MEYKYFSKNGEILPIEDAALPLSNIEYQYGFGVYETIRVTNTVPFFLEEHLARLEGSARIIGLEHPFTRDAIESSILELIQKNQVDTCNVKLLLIGGKTRDEANLYILCLAPFFPDKKLYKEGVACITYEYERAFPHAKTLNMLQSYLAYRKAREAGAYDALLLNRNGYVTEGTRTNFFAITGKTLYTPPEKEILLGVTRKAVLQVAREQAFSVEERELPLHDLPTYDGLFLTSTSSKILPIKTIDGKEEPRFEALPHLMAAFDSFLSSSNGKLT